MNKVAPQLDIVVVSYNTRELTLEALSSVYEETQKTSFNLIVVDNNSDDGWDCYEGQNQIIIDSCWADNDNISTFSLGEFIEHPKPKVKKISSDEQKSKYLDNYYSKEFINRLFS